MHINMWPNKKGDDYLDSLLSDAQAELNNNVHVREYNEELEKVKNEFSEKKGFDMKYDIITFSKKDDIIAFFRNYLHIENFFDLEEFRQDAAVNQLCLEDEIKHQLKVKIDLAKLIKD